MIDLLKDEMRIIVSSYNHDFLVHTGLSLKLGTDTDIGVWEHITLKLFLHCYCDLQHFFTEGGKESKESKLNEHC